MIETDNVGGEIINIGNNNEISIRDLAEKIKNLMDSNIEITSRAERERVEGSEVNRLYADISKASKIINWKPSYSLDDGLKLTIEWFNKKENIDFYKLGYNI